MGEIKKVAVCKVKPYELVGRNQGDKDGEKNYQGVINDDKKEFDFEDDKKMTTGVAFKTVVQMKKRCSDRKNTR